MKLLVIADDFTGATDIASFLVENGLTTTQINGVPDGGADPAIDAYVISLKIRSCEVELAKSQALAACQWGQAQGAEKYFFKYCSTFDSTEKGNIGPITDALLEHLGERSTVICPALPVNGRSVYQGYLFVGNQLLNESGMQNHPITPMKDANLLRLMQMQAQGKAALIDQNTVNQGVAAVKAQVQALKTEAQYLVIDSIDMGDLDTVGEAIYDEMTLFTGGSGLGGGLANYLSKTQSSTQNANALGAPVNAESVVLSGSCSLMTQAQVKTYQVLAPSLNVDVEQAINDDHYIDTLITWYDENKGGQYAPLIYATADAESLKRIQSTYGQEKSSQAIENLFATLAAKLKSRGVKNFIVAGGETSGAVTQGLDIRSFYIGPKIAAGVPWVKCTENHYSLALKSGNFGDENFFATAQEFYRE